MLTTSQIIKKYGTPNEKGIPYLTTITVPFPLIIAWDKKMKTNKITCHKMVADNFKQVFKDLLDHYGQAKIHELGIDLYGGCFNFRKKRGGTNWSTHSWGIAIDLDPERNQLKQTKKTARFARPAYKPMIDIFYKNGFLSYGVERDFDWMHFEIAK